MFLCRYVLCALKQIADIDFHSTSYKSIFVRVVPPFCVVSHTLYLRRFKLKFVDHDHTFHHGAFSEKCTANSNLSFT